MSEKMVLPAGKWYIGDLCYVMHDAWTEVCDLMFPSAAEGSNMVEGVLTLKDGRQFAIFSTSYGDGVYYDQWDNEYPVDAGSIGCIRLDDIKDTDADINLGAIIDFDHDFVVSSDGENLKFGHIIIPTGAEDYDEE